MTASGLLIGYETTRSPKIERRTTMENSTSKADREEGLTSKRISSSESLLAQALEVPSLLVDGDKHCDNTTSTNSSSAGICSPTSLYDTDDTPQSSSSNRRFPGAATNNGGVAAVGAPSATITKSTTALDSSFSDSAAAVAAVSLPLHSDFTVPTSNIIRKQSDATVPTSNCFDGGSMRRSSSINKNNRSNHYNMMPPSSPPADLTSSKRRTIMGTNAKSKYNVRSKESFASRAVAAARNNNNEQLDEAVSTAVIVPPPQSLNLHGHHGVLSMSPPHTPPRRRSCHNDHAYTPTRLFDVHATEPPTLSPLTPYDRQRMHPLSTETTTATTNNGSSIGDDDDDGDDVKDLAPKRPRRLHETIHAQSLLIGLAFLAIWSPNNIMAPNLTQMAETTFHMRPEERDLYLGSYCALAVGVFSLPISGGLGFMVDFYSRKRLFVLCVLGAVVATGWTAASTTFASLFLARVVTGGCMSASVPVAFSLLGDLFASEERNAASSGLSAMMGCGILVGQVYSGVVGPSLGWQHPFVVSSILNLVSAVAVAVWVREPDRGAKEKVLQELLENGNKYERKLTWQGFVHAMQTNMSNRMLLWQGFFTSLPWGIVFVFLNDYLSQEKGFSVPDATFMVMLFGIGCAFGGIGGGYIGQILQRYNRSYVPLFMAISTFLGMVPFLALLNSEFPNHHGYKAMLYSILAGCIASLPSVCVRPCILNVNPPETRGAALTAANLLVALGRGIGPSCITLLGGTFAVSRQTAFNTTLIVFWTITAIQLLFLAKYLPQDQDDMETELAQYAAAQCNSGDDEGGSSGLFDVDAQSDLNNNLYHSDPRAELAPLHPPQLHNVHHHHHTRISTLSADSHNSQLLMCDEETLVSMEEYISTFDGRAARQSFQFMKLGIREIKDEMGCLASCGSHCANSSEEEEEDKNDDGIVEGCKDYPRDLERRKEAWKRQRMTYVPNISTTPGTIVNQDANHRRDGQMDGEANEKTPLLIV